jgi:hypothetical protein
MILSSTAVIHVIVILASSGTNPDILDLDMFAMAILLLGSTLLFGPMMGLSDAVRRSRAQYIIAIWGF